MSYKSLQLSLEYIAYIIATYSTYSAHLNDETISYLIHLNIDIDKVPFEKSNHTYLYSACLKALQVLTFEFCRFFANREIQE